ncbi:hypothetical protein AB6A40_007027 [Gnathostoma spinigerum]|uniref:MARVEL domain-containing protein n=1 Tax=Gnathostoma spinigerum TaxID=75299 RepID=A0ABD6EK13_9BILA
MMQPDGPPIRFSSDFLFEKINRLKLIEMPVGIACLLCSALCFPNADVQQCSSEVHSFTQLFTAIPVVAVTLLCTVILTVCHCLDVPNAYYRFNFPQMEKLLSTLSCALYAVATIMLFIYLWTIPFVVLWLLEMALLVFAFAVYGYEAYQRWFNEYLV